MSLELSQKRHLKELELKHRTSPFETPSETRLWFFSPVERVWDPFSTKQHRARLDALGTPLGRKPKSGDFLGSVGGGQWALFHELLSYQAPSSSSCPTGVALEPGSPILQTGPLQQ